jgi:hypothetical protein
MGAATRHARSSAWSARGAISTILGSGAGLIPRAGSRAGAGRSSSWAQQGKARAQQAPVPQQQLAFFTAAAVGEGGGPNPPSPSAMTRIAWTMRTRARVPAGIPTILDAPAWARKGRAGLAIGPAPR